MIVVDTAVWAAFFNGRRTAQVARLEQALSVEDDLGVVPVILTEVLQGFRTDHGFSRARVLLTALPLLTLSADGHVAAARLFRFLRAKGVTVRGAVDCIIAQTCIASGAELLSPDRDFAGIARHSPLRLCAVRECGSENRVLAPAGRVRGARGPQSPAGHGTAHRRRQIVPLARPFPV